MWLQSAVLVTIAACVSGKYELSDDTCLADPDCPTSDQVCVWYSCIDPCSLTVCGTKNICDTVDHTRNCSVKGKSKEFWVSYDEINWYEALTYCDYKGMALATIETKEEQKKLEAVLNQTSADGWWLGGSDWLKETEFTWTSTGKVMTFTNFEDGQPDNYLYDNGERENCLAIKDHTSGYKWNDERCSYRQGFICKYYV